MNDILQNLDKIDDMDYDQVCQFERDLIQLQIDMKEELGILGLLTTNIPLRKELEKVTIRKRIIEIEKSEEAENYYLGVFVGSNDIREDEVVNGFNLYDCDYNLVEFTDYKDLKEIWIENKQISDEEFLKWIYNIDFIIISWSLIDKNGNLLDNFPEDQPSKIQYITEHLESNISSLLALPYPREILKYSILIGRDTVYDSPRYCNFFCEWLKRKIINKFLYKDIVQYIQKIQIFFNGKEKNKYIIAELVHLKYGHMYNFYQIYKMI